MTAAGSGAVTGWRDSAACLRADPELFYPSRPDDGTRAKAICSGCTVRATCLDDALATGDNQYGIRGGLGPAERRARLAVAVIPPDPDAAEHRAVLLRELGAFEAARRARGRRQKLRLIPPQQEIPAMTPEMRAQIVTRVKPQAFPFTSAVRARSEEHVERILGGMSFKELAALAIILGAAVNENRLREVVGDTDDGHPRGQSHVA